MAETHGLDVDIRHHILVVMLMEQLVTYNKVMLTHSFWKPQKITAPVGQLKVKISPTPNMWEKLMIHTPGLIFPELITPMSNKSLRSQELQHSAPS
jgi:hypothetical protein